MTGSSRYPRVLVVDPCPFNRHRNTGILKSSLFQGWPKDCLAAVDYSNMQPGFDVCESYWRLTKTDILRGLVGMRPIAGPLRKPRDLAGSQFDPRQPYAYEGRPGIEQRLSFLGGSFRSCAGELIFSLPSVLSRPLRRWIDEFRPDVIFSITGNLSMLRAVALTARWRGIPLVMYFTDDWMETAYLGQFGGFLFRPLMGRWLARCLDTAPVCITASEAMAEEYCRRYGGTFEALMQSVEPEDINDAVLPPAARPVVRFTFTGSLVPNRWQSLQAIGKALVDLRAEGLNGELHIYAPSPEIEEHGGALQLVPAVRMMGTASPTEIPAIQRDADVLVHAEGFDEATRRYTRLSFSTKIAQYLAAGRCVFAYGPEELASVRYIRDSGAGIAQTDESPSALRASLSRAILDASFRDQAGRQAVKVAMTYHNSNVQRERFRSILAGVAVAEPGRK